MCWFFVRKTETKQPAEVNVVAFFKIMDKALWKVFSEFIRLRDSDNNGFCKCITCGLIRFYKKMDCGHGIGRQHWGTRYSEKNNHAQCKKCNGFDGGRMDAYKEAVNAKYGVHTWDLLLLASKKGKRLSAFEIKELTNYYKSQSDILRSNKSF